MAASMGIDEQQIPYTTLAYLAARGDGLNDQALEQIRLVRWQTTALLNSIMPKGKKLKVTDLLQLPDEQPRAGQRAVTDQRAAEMIIAQFNADK